MDLGLRDRVAIVCAASQGLGKATAAGLAREGANVVICSRDGKRVREALPAIRKWAPAGNRVIGVTADLSKPRDIRRFVSAAMKEFGRVDILVTNAGGPPGGTFLELDDRKWQAGIDLNLMSAIRCIREVIPHMQKRQWGRIINITSLTVKQPANDLIISSTVRPGVIGLSKILANLYGKEGITVNSVAPGYILTARQEQLSSDRAAKRKVSMQQYINEVVREIPAGRFGEPEELANAIVFLASERASYINGATLSVDGGLVRGLF